MRNKVIASLSVCAVLAAVVLAKSRPDGKPVPRGLRGGTRRGPGATRECIPCTRIREFFTGLVTRAR
ncbi:hypothetical protein ACM614_16500 [Streptomyces sp. 12297]|uniref:hypothetical protein n=1 Tax=Streptomyces sp. NBC_00239 TaxID=2903640 RepID=UPI002E2E3B72|nr:hypothetical protein [Streptomyces sp. NBC_00239]